MRIVNKSEFYDLPEGTLYSNYEPCIISGLNIKGKTIYSDGKPIDYYYTDIIDEIECESSSERYDILEKAEKEKASFFMDYECESRDGMFDDEEMFCVYDKSDIIKLINKLKSINNLDKL